MNIILLSWLQVGLLCASSLVIGYATRSAETVDSIMLQSEESVEKLVFGAKTAPKSGTKPLPESSLNASHAFRSATNGVQSQRNSSRKAASSSRATSRNEAKRQRNKQYDIPLVEKSSATSFAPEPQRSRSRSHNSSEEQLQAAQPSNRSRVQQAAGRERNGVAKNDANARRRQSNNNVAATPTTATTIRPTFNIGNFQFGNPFNFLPPNLWNLSNPHNPPVSTKHPPKNPPAQKEAAQKEKDKRATGESLREHFNCPRESEVRFQLFPKICKVDDDCAMWKRDELCCEIFGAHSCVSGIPKPLEESKHEPILGLIPRKCPSRPLAELWWDVKECDSDLDCWPNLCCPDGRRRYCRTSQPDLEPLPVPVKRSINYLTEYLECTPPPPPIFDLHPKACTSTLDCFPNVCCQEAGLRHCRPPKKSVLTLMANVFNVDFVKRLTQNIVIKR